MCILDGNLEPELERVALLRLEERPTILVAVTVMPGPQVAPAIRVSAAIREARPEIPIVWGGYFPTLYPDAAIRADYVDYLVRGQGEETLVELLASLEEGVEELPTNGGEELSLASVRGLTRKVEGRIAHHPERPFRRPSSLPRLPYHLLESIDPYLRPSFLGRRTGVYQAAIGCRYHCEFCGVVSMFQGATHLQTGERLREELLYQRDHLGVDGVQLYDHNFFDREENSLPLLEAMVEVGLPWWCYARADTLAGFSPSTWDLIRRSRLAMAYIGAEAASDEILQGMRKGTRVEQTFEVARLCRDHGVIPEFSFIVGGPEDPEGEMERTFRMVRKLKRLHPRSEIILYVYTPTPQKSSGTGLQTPQPAGRHVALPETPEEWAQAEWVDFVCHRNAPWLTGRNRRRLRDFRTVLAARFPTLQDERLPSWGRSLLQGLASWRWESGIYVQPIELRVASRLLRLRRPERESI